MKKMVNTFFRVIVPLAFLMFFFPSIWVDLLGKPDYPWVEPLPIVGLFMCGFHVVLGIFLYSTGRIKQQMLTIGLIILSAVANAIMDIVSFRWSAKMPRFMRNNEQFWNPAVSGDNKWRDGEKDKGEAFPLSSTVLVFLTDGWHLMKFVMITCLMFAVAIHYHITGHVILDVVLLKIIFSGVFQFLFSRY